MLTRRQIIELALGAGTLAVAGADTTQAKGMTKEDVFFDKDAPVLGNPKGDLTIVEFFDYQCPYCKKGHPTMMDIVGKDGNIRLVMKDWPIFGEVSVIAAQAVLASATLGKYRPAMEALMKLPGRLEQDQIDGAFAKAGIPMQEVVAAANRDRKRISALLDRNYGQALAFNFAGTPSFVIGTTLYPGALDGDGIRQAIARARKKT